MLIHDIKVLVPACDGQRNHPPSRQIESGLDLLDNNAVNLLMALVMSVGGMLVASVVWGLPLRSILS